MVVTHTTGDTDMSCMSQTSKSGNSTYNGGRADMDEQRECIQRPFKGHWRDVVCNLCDLHGLSVCAYAN